MATKDNHRHGERHSGHRSSSITLEDVKEDINSLQAEVIDLTRDIRAVGMNKARSAINYVNGHMDSLANSSSNVIEKVEKEVKEKPGRSITLAFALGLLTSFLLTRRN